MLRSNIFIPHWERKKILTERMKEFLLLRSQNYSIQEIAQKMGITYGTANQILVKARKRIKEDVNGIRN